MHCCVECSLQRPGLRGLLRVTLKVWQKQVPLGMCCVKGAVRPELAQPRCEWSVGAVGLKTLMQETDLYAVEFLHRHCERPTRLSDMRYEADL